MPESRLYPFSTQKHAHDIEFALNRAHNTMHDMEMGEMPSTPKEYKAVCRHCDELEDLLSAVLDSRDGKVCWLTGKQLSLAREMVAWAYQQRNSA